MAVIHTMGLLGVFSNNVRCTHADFTVSELHSFQFYCHQAGSSVGKCQISLRCSFRSILLHYGPYFAWSLFKTNFIFSCYERLVLCIK